ncbi:putative sulfate exporter family transporter [Curtobacterium sp. MCSS17_015]|uniref:YeiH family protein n=1 Tax=Curtobacterium sp. MCSS17_015 TaxID=2175666 RepID=UPI000DA94609|nr:putative sulfate exporter family transporter [Curtobacterium sp. MCSS17_015]WIB25602.1 putative sulfate exporter family transporter [Curtobacterium sp. MCSS17_015]
MTNATVRPLDRAAALVPGLALATGIAVVATVIGRLLPVVGAPVSGVLIGAVIGTIRRPGALFRPGISTASRTVLQSAVVLLGAQLSLAQVARAGVESLPVMLGTLAVCLLAAWGIGRALGVVGNLRTLIGVGTGICGASAIAAVTPVIGAVSIEVAYAVSTIFLFNVAAVVVFPVVGHALGMSQHAFGLFAGTAVNDTSSVVAAASTYGPGAADFAVVVKLVRTLMIIPVVLVLAWLVGRRTSPGTAPADGVALDGPTVPSPTPARWSPRRVFRLVPWFLIGFVLVAAVNSTGLVPGPAHPVIAAVAAFLITVALSAIGLSTDVAGFRRAGLRPVLLGGSLWIVVSVSSLGLQALTGSI